MVIKVQFYNIAQEGAILHSTTDLVLWPSGLRRQVKVLVSSEARVRTPRVSILVFVFFCSIKASALPWRWWGYLASLALQTYRKGCP